MVYPDYVFRVLELATTEKVPTSMPSFSEIRYKKSAIYLWADVYTILYKEPT
jgi:hypothetical protein